jgi:hypothetical protein
MGVQELITAFTLSAAILNLGTALCNLIDKGFFAQQSSLFKKSKSGRPLQATNNLRHS